MEQRRQRVAAILGYEVTPAKYATLADIDDVGRREIAAVARSASHALAHWYIRFLVSDASVTEAARYLEDLTAAT